MKWNVCNELAGSGGPANACVGVSARASMADPERQREP